MNSQMANTFFETEKGAELYDAFDFKSKREAEVNNILSKF
jgi:hypothetical protein